MSARNPKIRPGNTLIQAIVAIAILLNFGGIVAIWAHHAQGMQMNQQTANGLKQCAAAVHNCHDQMKKIPPIEGAYGQKIDGGTFH